MAWIIVNIYDEELAWSDVYGWVSEDYDTYDDEEQSTLSLPIEGAWFRVPWSKKD